ncbi:MAG: ATPase, T2SS/T4P/T4SS family, partial [Planctomycetota bacterium]|nr:ATPase, T2SS/T4P/T4SS family [Planctomycetota bacterium]
MSATAPTAPTAPPTGHYKGRPLGRILIKMGRVNRKQVHEGLAVQKSKRGPIGQILIDLGYIEDTDLQFALAAQIGMEPVDLDAIDIQPETIKIVSNQMANTYRIIPVEYDSSANTLMVAMSSPDNFQATDDLRKLLDINVKPMIATAEQIATALARYYPEGAGESINDLLKEIAGDEDLAKFEGRGESIDLEELKDLIEANPVKKLLNLVLLTAIRDHASDIHFEPFEDEYKMRYRIDGVLYEMMPPPRFLAMAIATRIKVMADLDIAERRLPQDGRISLTMGGNPIDLRIAVLPTMFGESVVMRVLDRGIVNLDLDKLGLREDDLGMFHKLIKRPHGIIVNTGPTGSGKTTTLYAALNTLNEPSVKILTAEDPVEY